MVRLLNFIRQYLEESVQPFKKKNNVRVDVTAAWLTQLGERRSAEREVAGKNPDRTNTQGL